MFNDISDIKSECSFEEFEDERCKKADEMVMNKSQWLSFDEKELLSYLSINPEAKEKLIKCFKEDIYDFELES